jgi:ribosome recycling factor
MPTGSVFGDVNAKMDQTLGHLAKELAGIRTGRASTGLLEGLSIDYYGTETPIGQVASITVPDPLTLAIQPWEKQLLQPIEKAILTSDLGLNPNNDGKIIRITMPPLTEERRRDLTKHVKKVGEESKIAARNLRREGIEKIKKLEKDKEISEDDSKRSQEKIQKILDDHIARIEKMVADKENEIMDR